MKGEKKMNFKKVGLKKKVVIIIILLLFIWLAGRMLFGVNQATRAIIQLPELEITLVNDDGEETKITVRKGTAASSFVDVDPDVIKENVLYHSTPFTASASRIIQPVGVPIQVARFDGENRIIQIFDIPANTEKRISTEERYKHTLVAVDGFFEENNISVEKGTTIK